jgi:hypothetical protein
MTSINQAVTEIGAVRLQEAFQKYSFVYGTCGSGSAVGKATNVFLEQSNKRVENERKAAGAGGKWMTKVARNKDKDASEVVYTPSSNVLNAPSRIYDPGARASGYLRGDNKQMMDCYYGQAGTEVHLLRDPVIGEFIHKAMGFNGGYSQKTSGREAYLATHPGNEGWAKPETGKGKSEWGGYHYPDPDDLEFGLSATKAMSVIVRFGVSHFGGTLILDGAGVFWRDVFIAKRKEQVASEFWGGAISDTAREGISLMKYFVATNDCRSNVEFGNGRLIFNWKGKEIEPSKDLFKAYWKIGPVAHTPSLEDSTMRPEFKRFKQFTIGSMQAMPGASG